MMALCGPSGSGKTTLAKEIASRLGVTFVPSRAGEVFKSLGLDVQQPMTFEQRMLAQEGILETHLADVKASTYPCISDRSGVDMASYTMMHLATLAETEEDQDRLLRYVDKCLTTVSWNFNLLILIQPGITFEPDPKRPVYSKTEQELMNTLCFSYMRDTRINSTGFYLKRGLTDFEERVHAVLKIIEDQLSCLEAPCHPDDPLTLISQLP